MTSTAVSESDAPTDAPAGFRVKYERSVARNESLLCVGLDPDPDRIPAGVDARTFLLDIIQATSDLVCCYKPNIAFYEHDVEHGLALLRDVIAAVPDGIPVLVDAKRGDIGNTARFYAKAIYEGLGADAVTLNPYLGRDALEPFLEYEQRYAFVLCHTSNAGAADVQELTLADDGAPLFERVARNANDWNERGNVGLVVGATFPEQAARIRAICPDLPLLLPGIGAQDGDLRLAVRSALDSDRAGILVNASRGILYAGDGADYASAAHDEARRLRDEINAARG